MIRFFASLVLLGGVALSADATGCYVAPAAVTYQQTYQAVQQVYTPTYTPAYVAQYLAVPVAVPVNQAGYAPEGAGQSQQVQQLKQEIELLKQRQELETLKQQVARQPAPQAAPEPPPPAAYAPRRPAYQPPEEYDEPEPAYQPRQRPQRQPSYPPQRQKQRLMPPADEYGMASGHGGAPPAAQSCVQCHEQKVAPKRGDGVKLFRGRVPSMSPEDANEAAAAVRAGRMPLGRRLSPQEKAELAGWFDRQARTAATARAE